VLGTADQPVVVGLARDDRPRRRVDVGVPDA
jgi:hypothetical protein